MSGGKKISVILFFILVIFLFHVYATKITMHWTNAQNCAGFCAELINNEVVVNGENYSGVIIQAGKGWQSEWTPNKGDIKNMETYLSTFIEALGKKASLRDSERRFLQAWPGLASYQRSYRGEGAGGDERYIEVTFFSPEMVSANNGPGPFPNWRCPNYQIFEGAEKKFGDKAYFRINFKIKDKSFYCQY